MNNTQEIKAHADSISLDPKVTTNQFCEVWPSAKQGLTLLGQLIKNPIVKITISAIVAAGDAVADKVCGQQ